MLPIPRRKSQKQQYHHQQQYKVHPGDGEIHDTIDDNVPFVGKDNISEHKEFIVEETSNAANSISKWWRVRKLHNRIKSKWTPEHLLRVKERQRQIRVQRRIREILLFIIYLIFLNSSILSPYSDSSLYYFTRNMKNLFIKSLFLYENQTQLSFSNIQTIQHVYQWLQGPLYSSLYGRVNHTEYTILQHGYVLGGISIGQLRVLPIDCTYKVPFAVDGNTKYWCYGTDTGQFDTTIESTESFGRDAIYSWESMDANIKVANTRTKFFSTYDGAVSYSYPAPAFRIALAHDNEKSFLNQMNALESNGYVDIQTRVLFVDLTIFNVMLESVLVIRFAFEFPAAGGVVPTTEFTLVPYSTIALNPLLQPAMIIVAVFFLLYFLLLLRACRKFGWPIFRRLDTWIQLFNLIAFIVMWLLRLTSLLDFPQTQIESAGIESFRSYAHMYTLSQRFGAAVCFLSYLRLILFLDILPHVNLIVKTVYASVVEISSFLFVFGLFVYAYATCYCVVFGTSVEMFSTVTRSYTSLLQSLVGDIEYNELRATSPVMTAFLFIAFTLVAVFVLVHIAIAIIVDAYWQGKANTKWDHVNLVTETICYFWLLGHQFVHFLARVFGISALLEETENAPMTPTPIRDRFLGAKRPMRLSLIQRLVMRPLVSTHATIERLGHSLTQNHLIRSGVDGIRRGTQIVHQTTNQIAGHLQSFGEDNMRTTANHSNRLRSRQNMSGNDGNGSGASDAQMKALQGMIIQLAHQNTKMQQTLNNLQTQLAELRETRNPDNPMDSTDID